MSGERPPRVELRVLQGRIAKNRKRASPAAIRRRLDRLAAELIAKRLRERAAKPNDQAPARWAVAALELRIAPLAAALAREHLASIGSLLDETAVGAFALERTLLESVLRPRRGGFAMRFLAGLPAVVEQFRRNEWYLGEAGGGGGAASGGSGATGLGAARANPRARALVTSLIEANERLEPRRARVVYMHVKRGMGVADIAAALRISEREVERTLAAVTESAKLRVRIWLQAYNPDTRGEPPPRRRR